MNGGEDPVVITGMGAVTPLGLDVEGTWRRVLAGESALRHWADLEEEGFPMPKACRVSEGIFGDGSVPDRRRGRALGTVAAGEALEQAGLIAPDGTVNLEPERVGVFVGTTMGESAVFEDAARTGEFDHTEGGGQVFAETVASRFGLLGPRRTFGTACAAGNYAIGSAARALAAGRADVAVAGGVEPFSRIAMLGFGRMRAMAPDGCRPFGVGRRGMTLGEGAGFVVMERLAHADARGAKPFARVGGLGLSADAHHPTAPLEDGSGMAAAMRAGLQHAGVAADQVGWISAHGTGTPRSDAAEALALHTIFGESPPPVSSVKGALGHSLGAATAIEAVLAVCALTRGVLPPNTAASPDFEVDDQGLDVVTYPREATDLKWVMSCGYAFGGLNSALILGRMS